MLLPKLKEYFAVGATAILALHCVLQQVRPAEGHSERDNKLFVGMVPKTADEAELRDVFM